MNEEHTWVERRVPEHLAEWFHEAITLILKSHGYDDEGDKIKDYTPEELSEGYRTGYLKGYEQAERDNDALIKKLVKDISDLSAARLDLINDHDLVGSHQHEMLKLYSEIDTLKDSLARMAELSGNAEINQYAAKRGTDRSNFIAKLGEALDLIKYPEVRNRENRIKWLQEYLNELKASRTMEVKDVLIEVKK
jgi:hypothetical protein